MTNKEHIQKLYETTHLSDEDLRILLTTMTKEDEDFLYECAREVRHRVYGHDVYMRGLIEFSSICKNDCFYCGLRRSNKNAERYRLTKEQILSCTDTGYELGFRTFVLQSGEDPYYTDELICEIVSAIKNRHPDCAITLSIGEKWPCRR